jgi:hypothetical protein
LVFEGGRGVVGLHLRLRGAADPDPFLDEVELVGLAVLERDSALAVAFRS